MVCQLQVENVLFQKAIGAVRQSWNDYDGKLHTNKLNDLLLFLYSTVKIIIATVLSEYIKDDEGKWVLTKIKCSIFTWGFGDYKKTTDHSEYCLP